MRTFPYRLVLGCLLNPDWMVSLKARNFLSMGKTNILSQPALFPPFSCLGPSYTPQLALNPHYCHFPNEHILSLCWDPGVLEHLILSSLLLETREWRANTWDLVGSVHLNDIYDIIRRKFILNQLFIWTLFHLLLIGIAYFILMEWI